MSTSSFLAELWQRGVVLKRCEALVGTENRVRTAVKRGMTPLAAYEKFGAF